jgi:hypothetical protein
METHFITTEVGYEGNVLETTVRKVLAIMGLDETGPGKGLALRDWYNK